MWFPWNNARYRGRNLQQTLLQTTPLILTGLAVAFAFRCGMFNIGGQGQYLVGHLLRRLGRHVVRRPRRAWFHILLAVVAATLAGALWAGIAGLLKATVGAHEVISTIMLNWIAIWVGVYLFGLGGRCRARSPPSRSRRHRSRRRSSRSSGATPLLQGLHDRASSSRSPALVVYWVMLNRTTLGYEVRAVGFNPEAARYGGINVRPELLPRDGDLGRLRRARRGDRHPRLAVPLGDERHPGLADRLHRHRRGPARPQHGLRRRASRRSCSAR